MTDTEKEVKMIEVLTMCVYYTNNELHGAELSLKI
jgi:hypothetical protein